MCSRIFFITGTREYMENCFKEGVMWSVASESNIQNKGGSLPEYATLQLPDDFSIILVIKKIEATTKYLCIRYQ